MRRFHSRHSVANLSISGTGVRPSFALCTCAYNESQVISEKIENLLALQRVYPDAEIRIYVDLSEDKTAEIVRSFGENIKSHIAVSRTGKTHGMNLLVSATEADIVVFSDANVMLDTELLTRLARHFEDPTVGCVCGNLIYVNAAASVTAKNGSAYWRLEQFIKNRESAWGSVMGADGSIFAIRRSLHVSPPDHIIDDMYVSFQILCAGYKVIQVQDVVAFEKSVTASAEEFRRKVRISCQAFNVHRLIWSTLTHQLGPWQLYMYVSHKLLRWFSIYFVVGGIASFMGALACIHLYAVACSVGLLIGITVLAGLKWSIPVVSSAVDLLTSLSGAGLGVWKSIRGEKYQTWQPASSIRN